jgi:predicted MFS family arabinose efflux permease
MGAIGSTFGTLLTMGAGAIIGRIAQSKLQDKVNPKLVAGGQVALGIFLPKLVKGKVGAGIGSGMAVNGIVTLANQFGVVSAISGMETSVDYVGGNDYAMDEMGYADSSIAGEYGDDNMGYADSSIAGDLDEGTMSGDYEDYGYSA